MLVRTLLLTGLLAAAPALAVPPNVVVIYADDLGYGDISCNGAKAGLTPNIDRLASEGLRFTDGHCSSATCTPSRYAILTGEYPWRRQGTGVLPGDAKLIIEPGRTTLPTVFKEAGYRTGAVGKWHLGLGDEKLDWNGKIAPGPLEIGFDECFIMAATGDRVPCVYVKNHEVVGRDPADPIEVRYDAPIPGEPTGKANPEMLRLHPSHGHDMAIVDGVSRIGYMKGGEKARWKDEDMADTFTSQAVEFIKKNKDKPFFLYFATHDIHVPRLPNNRFLGKSGMGTRGDAIVEFDWSVGEVVKAIDDAGLKENTLIVFSSDNGPVVDDGYKDEAVAKLGSHKPAGPYRGGKYSKFEGGTRVPFVVRWPGKVKPGESAALVCQIDFTASFAALVGRQSPIPTAKDSQNVLQALLGADPKGRETLIEQAAGLAVRRGKWKFIPASGGRKVAAFTNSELGNDPEPQLYDLEADPGETRNVAADHPEILDRLRKDLAEAKETQ
ncbi:sulfatase family protein [Paludisphaera rhizosphaerae]|uniref:sulfatase family protein n=1 Tax=Paludisphaera rhizosphaerae TaxID=2711216 RepID=UPI0013ED8427|nr:arylsulfatase [Paludisphaera rhizosphaerae]